MPVFEVGTLLAYSYASRGSAKMNTKKREIKMKNAINVTMFVLAAAAVLVVNPAHAEVCSHSKSVGMDQVAYGNSNIYKRYCSLHGWWDIRFSFSCPGCRAPKFGF